MRPTVRRRDGVLAAVVFAALTVASGCTYLAALDDLGPNIPACDDGDAMQVRDLWVVLEGMEPHRDQYAEFRLVSADDFVVAVAVYDGIPEADFTLHMRRAVVGGGLRLDFWSDYRENRIYDPPTADATEATDHSWRLPECLSGAYRFTHAGNFTDLREPPLNDANKRDAVLQLHNFDVHVGQRLALYLVDVSSDRTVGFYQLQSLGSGEDALVIPRIAEPGTEYEFAFYSDVNESGAYEPEGDHSWLRRQTADASGLVLDFPHTTPFDDITDYVKP